MLVTRKFSRLTKIFFLTLALGLIIFSSTNDFQMILNFTLIQPHGKLYERGTIVSATVFSRDWCRLQRWRIAWKDMIHACEGKMSWEKRELGSKRKTDGSRSYIASWDLNPAGHFSRFWIQSVDMDGKHKTFGGDSWRVYIRQGPASLAPVVIDHNNGLYEVLVLITEPGNYSAQIFLDYSLCDGFREPPECWFINGTDHGTYLKPKENILGYIGDDYIMASLSDQEQHNFTITGVQSGSNTILFSPSTLNHEATCEGRCSLLWDGHGYWKKGRWFPYISSKDYFTDDSLKKPRRSGTLWAYGDSLGMRFIESLRTSPLCVELFERCGYTYNWIYEVKDKRNPLKVTTEFNKTIILNKIRQILKQPDMNDSNSVLLISLGVHFPISLTFEAYKDLVDSLIRVLKEDVYNGMRKYRITTVWKSTAAIEKHKVTRAPWPAKPLNDTMFRFLTTQRNQLFHAYAVGAMCEAGLNVLDIYPLSAAYNKGTTDYVHYENRVFFPAEKAIENFVRRLRNVEIM